MRSFFISRTQAHEQRTQHEIRLRRAAANVARSTERDGNALDDVLAVGANSVCFFFMNVIGINWHAGNGFLSRTSRQERIDVIDGEKWT